VKNIRLGLNSIFNTIFKKMTKEILLIRHASAEESGFSSMLRDIDRELTSQGIMEAARIGKQIADLNKEISNLYCSPALRTAETAKIIAEQLKFPAENIQIEESLFGGGTRAYLSLVNALSSLDETIIIVGHNPDISFFADYLSKNDVGGHFNNATMVQLKFTNLEWAAISQKSAEFVRRLEVK
jgi:phosphohistidine phosphatase